MAETSQLQLPLVEAAQAQKHVTVNEAFARLDAFAQISLTSVGATVPPSSPVEGELHGVGAGASGVWAGQDGALALFLNGGWAFLNPALGWRGWSVTGGSGVVFDGVDWVEGAGALSPNGAGFVHRTVEVDHAVGAGVTSAIAAALPANSIVYGVTGRVLSTIGGAVSMDIGVAGSSDRYGSGVGVGAGAWARGITSNPLAYYNDTDLILTSTGGNFDGSGVFRVAIHFAELTLPRG